jgi:hypothetical protein
MMNRKARGSAISSEKEIEEKQSKFYVFSLQKTLFLKLRKERLSCFFSQFEEQSFLKEKDAKFSLLF